MRVLVACEYSGAVRRAFNGFRNSDFKDMGLFAMESYLRGKSAPAGFLKITADAVDAFMGAYPELCYGSPWNYSVDLFNHGVHEGVWYGEDYAMSRRWNAMGGQIWIIPDLDLTHWDKEKSFPGNFHQFLLRQPGGSESDNPVPPEQLKLPTLHRIAA